MRRPQFSLKTLLWLMLVVAAFFGGSAWQQQKLQDKLRASEETEKQLRQSQKTLLQRNHAYAREVVHWQTKAETADDQAKRLAKDTRKRQ